MSETLDSRQLKAFVTLAKTGSYTETAKQLFVTHSAISHAMRALEGNAGCRLLSRMGKKVILTEAGEALLQHAERVLDELGQARQTLNGLNKWGVGRLRLAADAALGPYFLTPALIRFHREFPRVLLRVELPGGCEARALIESNRVDLVLGEKPLPDDRLEFLPVLADRFQIVVNPAHPWAARGAAPREEFSKQTCVLHRATSQTRRLLEEYLARDGTSLNAVVELDNLDAVKEFVKQTAGISLLPNWAVARELKEKTLVALSPGRKAPDQTWGFSHARSRPLNHAEATFVKLCRKAVAELA